MQTGASQECQQAFGKNLRPYGGGVSQAAAAHSEPYRAMVLMAGCLGPRASETVGFQWRDFDFERSTVLVERAMHGRIDDVKTEYSRDVVPIDPEVTNQLWAYRDRCYPIKEAWLFANPATGKPYHQEEIQNKDIRPAAMAACLTYC